MEMVHISKAGIWSLMHSRVFERVFTIDDCADGVIKDILLLGI